MIYRNVTAGLTAKLTARIGLAVKVSCAEAATGQYDCSGTVRHGVIPAIAANEDRAGVVRWSAGNDTGTFFVKPAAAAPAATVTTTTTTTVPPSTTVAAKTVDSSRLAQEIASVLARESGLPVKVYCPALNVVVAPANQSCSAYSGQDGAEVQVGVDVGSATTAWGVVARSGVDEYRGEVTTPYS